MAPLPEAPLPSHLAFQETEAPPRGACRVDPRSPEKGPRWQREPWFLDHWIEVPVARWGNEAALDRSIEDQIPVVLQNGGIIPLGCWERIEDLTSIMARSTVLVKRSKRENVAYFRSDMNSGRFDFDAKSWVRENKMMFPEFVAVAEAERQKLKAGIPGDTLYCQESFNGHPELDAEFGSWKWDWIINRCKAAGWQLPRINVLFMGSMGATTPAHFDEQHNFLHQVRGRKLVVVFPHTDYSKMYPFPTTHPCDRCSMVEIRAPDFGRFPRFREAQGLYCILEPGDVLYIPYGWWHYCRNLDHLGASITFWAECDHEKETKAPTRFSMKEWTRARRNIEKLLAQQVGEPNLGTEVRRILKEMDDGNLEDSRIKLMRSWLDILQYPEAEQVDFLRETFQGRFGFEYNLYV